MGYSAGAGATVTVDDILKHTQRVLARVEAGATVVVTRADEPIVELRPVRQAPAGLRPCGLAAGMITVPEDFDDPLPDDVVAAFAGQ